MDDRIGRVICDKINVDKMVAYEVAGDPTGIDESWLNSGVLGNVLYGTSHARYCRRGVIPTGGQGRR